MTKQWERRPGWRAAALALVFLALLPGPPSWAEEEAGKDSPADLVILLDASQSVLPYFREISDFVVGPLMRSYLRRGDDFHLLSFGDEAQVELARRIESEEDLKAALGSLYLVAPLAPGSDLLGALRFLSAYLSALPPARPKTVVLITDGLHNPRRRADQALPSPAEISQDIAEAAQTFRGRGWTVRIVKVPFGPEARAEDGPEARAEDGPENRADDGPANRAKDLPAGLSGSAAPSRFATASESASAPAPSSGGGAASSETKAPVASGPGGRGPGASSLRTPAAPSSRPAAPTSSSGPPYPAPPSGSPPSASSHDSSAAPAIPGSPPASQSARQAEEFVQETARALGAELGEFPPETGAESGQSSLLLPELLFPGYLGPRGPRFAFTLKVKNPAPAPLRLNLETLLYQDRNLLEKPASIDVKPGSTGALRVLIALPPGLEPGRVSLELEAGFGGGQRVLNRMGTLDFELIDISEAPNRLRLPFILLGLLALALALGFSLRRFKARRKTPLIRALRGDQNGGKTPPALRREGPSRGRGQGGRASAASGPSVPALPAPTFGEGGREGARPARARAAPGISPRAPASFRPRIVAGGRARIELRVAGQNPHIGERNIHELHAGSSRSVGGGRSDFLIFLAPLPRHVAELYFDGASCAFLPLRPELFPGLEGPVEDCIGKEISLLGPRGQTLVLRFRRYEPPALRINRLLHCIEAPGIFVV